ncbi:MAG: hypothetical protein ACKVIY_18050, partial [Acidimicrobiales bacterium]
MVPNYRFDRDHVSGRRLAGLERDPDSDVGSGFREEEQSIVSGGLDWVEHDGKGLVVDDDQLAG